MKRYRVIQIGDIYKAQYKKWFGWGTYGEYDDFSHDDSWFKEHEFGNEYDATKYIEQQIRRESPTIKVVHEWFIK